MHVNVKARRKRDVFGCTTSRRNCPSSDLDHGVIGRVSVAQAYRFEVIQAAAWKLMAELFRRHAATQDLRLLELHPGASMRGQIRLMVERSPATDSLPSAVTFSFGGPSGTCDVEVDGRAVLEGMDFVTPVLKQDPIETVDRLERCLGLRRPQFLPPSTPAVLAVRTLSAVFSHQWLERTSLRATSGWVDATPLCTVPGWTRIFGEDLTELGDRVSRGELSWRDAHAQTHRFLAIHETLDGGPMFEADRAFVALEMSRGLLIFAGPSVPQRGIDLSVAYKSARRRLGPLVDEVLAHLRR